MDKLKIKYANFEIKNLNTKHNANKIIEILNNSLENDLVIFQDMALTGQFSSNLFLTQDFNFELLTTYDYILSNINYNNIFCFSSCVFKENKLYKVLLIFNNKQLIFKNYKMNIDKNEELFSSYLDYNNQIINYKNNKLLFTFFSDLKENIILVDNIIVLDNQRFIFNNNKNIDTLLNYTVSSNQNIIYHAPSYLDSSADILFSSKFLFIKKGQIIYINKDFEKLIDEFEFEKNKEYETILLDNYTNNKNENEIVKDPFNYNINKNGYLLLFKAMTKALEKKILSLNNFNKVIIGISGGLDSLLCLLVAYKTYLNMEKDPKEYIKVYSMPTQNSSESSKQRAYNLINGLNLKYNEINIDTINNDILKLLNHNIKDVAYENNQSRIRALLLLNLANIEKGIVLGTGDLSEDALGFNTFGGDGLFMYGINSSLSKTQIRKMVDILKEEDDFINIKDTIIKIKEAKISPELQKGQETEKIVGEYEINDFILYYFLIKKLDKKIIINKLIELFNLDLNNAENYYTNFLKRFFKNKFKLKTMSSSINLFEYDLTDNYYKVSSDNERY